MADVFTKLQRSRCMAAIKARGNRETELRLAEIFRKSRIAGWRRHLALPGKPDFIFPRERLAVFVDGCFWHGCPRHCRMPATNAEYWQAKISKNRLRDTAVNRMLRATGWRVVRVWQHSLKYPANVGARFKSLIRNRASHLSSIKLPSART